MQFQLEMNTMEPVGKVPQENRADFNENGQVDIGDVAKIAYYLAGKINKL